MRTCEHEIVKSLRERIDKGTESLCDGRLLVKVTPNVSYTATRRSSVRLYVMLLYRNGWTRHQPIKL